MNTLKAVEETIRREQLLEKGAKVVVAVSGGPDSVALLKLLRELAADWELQLIVGHVNHRFRGEESDREAEFVRRLAEDWNLPCEIAHIDVPQVIRSESLNAQVAAREKRYAFLLETAHKHGATKIALAHHADDQAETVLMRLIKGSGPSGLSGMAVKRKEKDVELIRPLLRITKAEILSYCELRKLEYMVDSSNRERKYFRNQVRLDVIPFLRQYNPRLTSAMNRLAEMMRGDDDFLEQQTLEVYRDIVTPEDGRYTFTRQSFISQHLALQRRLIKLILSYLSASHLEADLADFAKIELVRSAIVQGRTTSLQLQLSERVRFVREYDRIMLTADPLPAAENYEYIIHALPAETVIPAANAKIRLNILAWPQAGLLRPPGHKLEVWFDADQVCFPLTIRNRRDGDRMKVQGLNGTKKIKDLFIDEKIAASQRRTIPIVADAGNRILWIPGVRRSEHAQISGRTKRVLHMQCLYNIQ
jgi:tRNA(Ile)-lysidine synthase